MACCDLFANYFSGAINCINSELDAGLHVQNLDVLAHLSCRIVWDSFSACMVLGCRDRILQSVKPRNCLLDPCQHGL